MNRSDLEEESAVVPSTVHPQYIGDACELRRLPKKRSSDAPSRMSTPSAGCGAAAAVRPAGRRIEALHARLVARNAALSAGANPETHGHAGPGDTSPRSHPGHRRTAAVDRKSNGPSSFSSKKRICPTKGSPSHASTSQAAPHEHKTSRPPRRRNRPDSRGPGPVRSARCRRPCVMSLSPRRDPVPVLPTGAYATERDL